MPTPKRWPGKVTFICYVKHIYSLKQKEAVCQALYVILLAGGEEMKWLIGWNVVLTVALVVILIFGFLWHGILTTGLPDIEDAINENNEVIEVIRSAQP